MQAVVKDADPKLSFKVIAPRTVTMGSGHLQLSLTPNSTGHLHLFLWNTGNDKLYRLFPNDKDMDDMVTAGQTFSVPRTQLATPWEYLAEAPQGEWHVLAIVSEQERNFDKSSLSKSGDMLTGTRSALEARLAAGASYEALIGDVDCKAGADCTDRYGVGMKTITEVTEPVQPTRPAPIVKPAHKEAPPAPAPKTQRKASPEEEREYLRKLNQDLNNF
jgi:hypothetical protein